MNDVKVGAKTEEAIVVSGAQWKGFLTCQGREEQCSLYEAAASSNKNKKPFCFSFVIILLYLFTLSYL